MQKVSQLVWDCPQCGRRLAKHVERCLCGLRQQPTWDEQRSRTTKTGGTSVPSKADTTRASANSPSPNATSDSSATATSTCPQCRGNVPKTVERCPCGHWLHEKSSHAAIPSKPESTSKQRGFVSTAVVIALVVLGGWAFQRQAAATAREQEQAAWNRSVAEAQRRNDEQRQRETMEVLRDQAE